MRLFDRLLGRDKSASSGERNWNPWNDDAPKSYSGMWFGCQATEKHINRKISGDSSIGWVEHFLRTYRVAESRGSRCLLLGANEGSMERQLRHFGYQGEILSTDIADRALARAAERANAEGLKGIEYRVADLNKDRFEGPFDFIFAEGVLHHITNAESLLPHLNDILAPNGYMFGVEWAGPFRFQLPDQQIQWVNALLAAVPAELRPQYSGPKGIPPSLEYQKRIHYVRQPEAEVAKADPSEAILGTKLPELVRSAFRVVEWKGFGGTLLSYMGGHFPFERANDERYVEIFVEMLLAMEDKVIESGLFEDEFCAFAATKRRD